MTCEDFRGQYELYAWGVMDEPDRDELATHLARRCPVCTGEYAKALETNALLAMSTEAIQEPPKRLRRRVLASIGLEQESGFWSVLRWAPMMAALMLAFVFVGYREQVSQKQIAGLAQTVQKDSRELAQARQVMQFLNAPETKEVTFEKGQPARGRVFVNPDRGVLLTASNLPPAPAGKTYEMWIVPKQGAPEPAGIFNSDPNNTAAHVQRGAVDLSKAAAVAVSLEDENGSKTPTKVLFAVTL
jgi:hypothetical protein